MAVKLKKIDKEFLLTDNSVNCYGFRLLTEGYLIDEYKKNPIGYGMHRRDDGVLVRWEDFRLDGDKVYAKPVVNLSHENGQRTVEEIENGFLNAASVGHIVIIEMSEEASLKLDGQTGPTITKWFNRECSLVDVPGNFNALVKLFSVNSSGVEKEINLADFIKNQNPDMKQIFFTGAQLSALNLKAEATEVEVATAFNDLVSKAAKVDALQLQVNDLTAKAAKADGLQKQLDDLHAQVCTDEVKALCDAALAAGKGTKQLIDQLAADYAGKPKELKVVLEAMPVYKSVADQLGGDKEAVKNLLAKSWDELDEAGLLPTLKANDLAAFKAKHKEKFGIDYEGK